MFKIKKDSLNINFDLVAQTLVLLLMIMWCIWTGDMPAPVDYSTSVNIVIWSVSLISVQGVASHPEFLHAVSRHQFTRAEGSAVWPQLGRHQVPLLKCTRLVNNKAKKPFVMIFSLCTEQPWHVCLMKVTSFIPLMSSILSPRLNLPDRHLPTTWRQDEPGGLWLNGSNLFSSQSFCSVCLSSPSLFSPSSQAEASINEVLVLLI